MFSPSFAQSFIVNLGCNQVAACPNTFNFILFYCCHYWLKAHLEIIECLSVSLSFFLSMHNSTVCPLTYFIFSWHVLSLVLMAPSAENKVWSTGFPFFHIFLPVFEITWVHLSLPPSLQDPFSPSTLFTFFFMRCLFSHSTISHPLLSRLHRLTSSSSCDNKMKMDRSTHFHPTGCVFASFMCLCDKENFPQGKP